MIGCILIICKYQGRNAKTPSAPCKDKSQCLNGSSKLNSDYFSVHGKSMNLLRRNKRVCHVFSLYRTKEDGFKSIPKLHSFYFTVIIAQELKHFLQPYLKTLKSCSFFKFIIAVVLALIVTQFGICIIVTHRILHLKCILL